MGRFKGYQSVTPRMYGHNGRAIKPSAEVTFDTTADRFNATLSNFKWLPRSVSSKVDRFSSVLVWGEL